jgi:hypothetical protein
MPLAGGIQQAADISTLQCDMYLICTIQLRELSICFHGWAPASKAKPNMVLTEVSITYGKWTGTVSHLQKKQKKQIARTSHDALIMPGERAGCLDGHDGDVVEI